MTSKVDLIANKINEGNPVILYGACAEALTVIRELYNKWKLKPVCICDSDPRKCNGKIAGLEILSPDEAIAKYPHACYFITSRQYKYEITGFLLSEKNISSDRIIDFEEVENRTSCILLELYIVCTNHTLAFCCSDFGKNRSPYVKFNGDYDSTAKEFIDYRDKIISNLNNNLATPCDGCHFIKKGWFPKERKIRIFNDSEGGICNFNCCYCGSHAKISNISSKAEDNSKDIDTIKLRDAFGDNLMKDDLLTVIACGEITVHPNRSKIYESIRECRNSVFTNALVFDKKMQALLELNHTDLLISVDAGTRSTFAKIKGFDMFEKVCENIKRYCDSGVVLLKYIILPDINDNKEDIDGFITLCKDCKIELITLSYDINAPKALSEHTKAMVKYFVSQLSINGILYGVVSDVISKAIYEGQMFV